jgi:hypothetical protein
VKGILRLSYKHHIPNNAYVSSADVIQDGTVFVFKCNKDDYLSQALTIISGVVQ